MSYRIVAHRPDRQTGVAKPTATEALEVLSELLGAGFTLTAVIDDDGDNIPVERLAELARSEGA